MHNKKSTDSDLWLHNPTLNCCMCLNIKSLKGKKFMEKVTKKQAIHKILKSLYEIGPSFRLGFIPS